MFFPKIGLLTHHEPKQKREILRTQNLMIGKYTDKLINAEDLSYFNNGIGKLQYSATGNKIISGD